MTFDEFRNTKERISLQDADEKGIIDILDMQNQNGFVITYMDSYYIEEIEPSVLYHMIIGRCEFESAHLDILEAKLWLFYCEEYGLFDEEIKIRERYEILDKNWYW